MSQRHRLALLCLAAGAVLAWTGGRHTRPAGFAARDIAGRWTVDFISFTNTAGTTHFLGTAPGDTLTIFADGRWLTPRTSTRFTLRHDSLVFPTQNGSAVFAVRMIGPGEPRLSLRRRATYDFNADGLAESAVQETVFRRVRPRDTGPMQ